MPSLQRSEHCRDGLVLGKDAAKEQEYPDRILSGDRRNLGVAQPITFGFLRMGVSVLDSRNNFSPKPLTV
jgi:hypothetical protein